MRLAQVFDEELAAVKIDEDVDVVMVALMRELGLEPPPPYEFERDALMAEAVTAAPGEPVSPWTCTTQRGTAVATEPPPAELTR
jgi:hypothetical protein